MAVTDHTLRAIDGNEDVLQSARGNVALLVNVASKCGLTPQYAGLQSLYETYAERGFTVIGFPCNQFLGQEPGSPEEIAAFCATMYSVTFPLSEKIDVNGDGSDPLYAELRQYPDADGYVGDIRWNFEKFLVDRDGEVIGRFAPQIEPDALRPAIEAAVG